MTFNFALNNVFWIFFGNVMHVRDGGQQKIAELRRCSCIKELVGESIFYITLLFALKTVS